MAAVPAVVSFTEYDAEGDEGMLLSPSCLEEVGRLERLDLELRAGLRTRGASAAVKDTIGCIANLYIRSGMPPSGESSPAAEAGGAVPAGCDIGGSCGNVVSTCAGSAG